MCVLGLKYVLLPGMVALWMAALVLNPARASEQIALDHGCFNCHGTPPRGKAPTFPQLAERYASSRGDAKAQEKLAGKLRDGSIFSHIDAHERLSPELAAQLIRWISEGAQ